MGVFPKEKEQRDELSEVVLGHLIASVENLTNFIDLHFLQKRVDAQAEKLFR